MKVKLTEGQSLKEGTMPNIDIYYRPILEQVDAAYQSLSVGEFRILKEQVDKLMQDILDGKYSSVEHIEDSEGTQVTDIAKKVGYPQFKKGKQITTPSFEEGKVIQESTSSNVIKGRTITQGDFTYEIPDFNPEEEDIFSIKVTYKGTRHLTNEPYTSVETYDYRYNRDTEEVESIWFDKSGSINVSSKITHVPFDRWVEYVSNPVTDLIPWQEGAWLD